MNDIVVYTQWEDLSGFSVDATSTTNTYRNIYNIYITEVPRLVSELDLFDKAAFGLFASYKIKRIQYTTNYE